MPFTHLHLHTEYSLLDGFARIDRLFDRVLALGMDSVAITDHGVMFGVVDFYKMAKAKGVRPIIGCEVYMAPRDRFSKDPVHDKQAFHLVLLAENQTGYQNLIKLVSQSFKEGFYYKPRIDKALLKMHSEGIIALSACLAGEIQSALNYNNFEEAKRITSEYLTIFDRDHFYLELQDHGLAEQKKVNTHLLKLANDLSVKLVATNDVHYIDREEAFDHDVLLAIQTGRTLSDPDRMRFAGDAFYLKSPEEMATLFSYCPEAIANTEKIAARCQFEYDFNTLHLPSYLGDFVGDSANFLEELCLQGVKKRYADVTKTIEKRLNYELDTIKSMGYADYFLIVWDFVKYAKDNGILVGPCRGSGGGSIVAYCLEITDVDPLKYNLIFERFLNPERITMPDFDIDFQDDRRSEVIDYVIAKYGADRVAQIITFGTLGARAAIRDVGRVLGMPYKDVDAVAKQIPFTLGITIDKALSKNEVLKERYQKNAEIKRLIDIARSLEGMPRHASTHAAGVVITANPVADYVPLYLHDNSLTTQFNMTLLEELGLLKMDFLGLKTLTIIGLTLERIKISQGITLDLKNLPLDDSKTYELISKGDTLGVFQLESKGMIRFLRELKPASMEDIIAGISLYRPGPMESIPKYIKNKNNPQKISYVTPQLKGILDVTYGCLVYQEQVMQVVRKLAGYSYGRSDLVRRAMSKKKMDVMEKERKLFIYGKLDVAGQVVIPGCIRNGVSESAANVIFDDMVDFAKYAFNKSHAAGYAIIAYQTAYLKVHYTTAFMAACMTASMGSLTKVAQFITECKQRKIAVLAPDINTSFATFTVENKAIRFGLMAIKNVGKGIIKSIISERKKAPFIGFSDFLNRIAPKELSKKTVESLIKAGACDGFKKKRSQLLQIFESEIDNLHRQRRFGSANQISLLDNKSLVIANMAIVYPDCPELSITQKLNFEREMVGIYLSGHPLESYAEKVIAIQTLSTADLYDDEGIPDLAADGKRARLCGILTQRVEKVTKNNQTMAFIQLEDLEGSIEVIVFSSVYVRYNKLLLKDSVIIVEGSITMREDEPPKLIAEHIYALSDSIYQKFAKTKRLATVYVQVTSFDVAEKSFLSSWARTHSGQNPLKIYDKAKSRVFAWTDGVSADKMGIKKLIHHFGEKNVIVK